MRLVCLVTLLLVLPVPVLAQASRLGARTRQPNSARVREWAERVMSSDAKVRADAQAALVQGGARSLRLLRRLLDSDNEDLQFETSEIIRRIGPPAIPMLAELLRHEQVPYRRFAADALIDLAP